MQRRRLGQSGLVVSEICMGTMTFGSQCDEGTSHAICDHAFDAGIDFFDAAEVYPVPPQAETVGLTEQIFGRWLKGKPRDAVLVATKVTGPAHGWFAAPVRHQHCALDRRQIRAACEASLQRLGTDLHRSLPDPLARPRHALRGNPRRTAGTPAKRARSATWAAATKPAGA